MLNDNSNVFISVSDEEPDELGRMQSGVPRKRWKPGVCVRAELTPQLVRSLVKYWILLILVAAAGLLLFEASRIGKKPGPMEVKMKRTSEGFGSRAVKKPSSEGNLNRLDPTTRVVGGVRERK